MAVPISFPSTTSNFALPLLFAGQAQKEFFINESLTLVDALLRKTVEESTHTPPVEHEEGSCFRVIGTASGAWLGQEGKLAISVGGSWQFIDPKIGMSVFDAGAGVFLHYNGVWESPVEPTQASGGATVDAEARQMLVELVEALQKMGIFADSP